MAGVKTEVETVAEAKAEATVVAEGGVEREGKEGRIGICKDRSNWGKTWSCNF